MGLALQLIGAAVVARAAYVTPRQAIDLGVTRFAGSNDTENLQLPTVRNLVRQSRAAIVGLLFVIVGTGCQLFGAWPSEPRSTALKSSDRSLAEKTSADKKVVRDNNRTDPPMKPDKDSIRWFESSPDPIERDLATSVLVARVGMASNSLTAQFHAARDASRRTGVPALMQQRDIVLAFMLTAALTNEAIRLARENMSTLRRLAVRGGAPNRLLEDIGRLCGGQHPACQSLARARNKLAFHWDEELVAESVREFARNKKIVWFEAAQDDVPIYTFGFSVLNQAMFPGISEGDVEAQKTAIRAAMDDIAAAVDLITEFFTAANFGFMHEQGGERRVR